MMMRIKQDAYVNERCKLDLYYPEDSENFSTVVWFHGGGLRAGNKSIPEQLKNKGIAVAGVNYRLFPKVKCPEYIRDAAAATAWVMRKTSPSTAAIQVLYLYQDIRPADI